MYNPPDFKSHIISIPGPLQKTFLKCVFFSIRSNWIRSNTTIGLHSGSTFFSVNILVEKLIFFLNFPILSLCCKSRIFLHISWHISDEKHGVLISFPALQKLAWNLFTARMCILMSCLICLNKQKGGYFKLLEDTQTNRKSNLHFLEKPSRSCSSF